MSAFNQLKNDSDLLQAKNEELMKAQKKMQQSLEETSLKLK